MTDLPVTELFLIRDALRTWFAEHQRSMPWRDHPDPYAVWVSEIMLQQTRVDTVRAYFERWMQRFPTIESLANADESEVLLAWQGLGYYSRARNLQRAARKLVAEFGGRLPADVDALKSLPGVGPYTAGAVASIAFGIAAPAVDGNVIRVISRLALIDSDVRRSAALKRIHRVAAALVDEDRPGDFNQSLMELGSVVCTPTNPKCGVCPIATVCKGLSAGVQDKLPLKSRSARPRVEQRMAVLMRAADTDRLLLARRPNTGLLAGLWEFPLATDRNSVGALTNGVEVYSSGDGPSITHQFSHIHLTMHPQHLTVACEFDANPEGYVEARWFELDQITAVPISTMMEKLLTQLRSGI